MKNFITNNFKLTAKKLIFSTLAMAVLTLTACNSNEEEKEKTSSTSANLHGLSFMGGYADAHPTTTKVFKPFIEQVKKDLNGEISFDYFSGNVLYPEKEAYAVLSDGRVDFGVVRPGNFPGIINLLTIIDVPGIAPNAIVGSLLIEDIMEKFPEIKAELPKNSVSYANWASASYQLHTLSPVKTVEEVKGKKVIVWDAVAYDAMQKLGANPIRINATDTYLSLSKGMADGVLCPLAIVRSFKISDVAKHHLQLDLGVGSFNLSIFEPLWNDFSAEQQAYFKKEGGLNFSLKVGKSLEDGAIVDLKWMQGLGHQFYTLTPEGREKMLQSLASFKEEWLERMEKAGHKNAKEILAYTEERSLYYQDKFDKGEYGNYNIQ